MSYRAEIQARAREAAEAARDEVLHAELRGLENLLAFCRAEPIPDKQQIDEIRRTIKWVRRLNAVAYSPIPQTRRDITILRSLVHETEPREAVRMSAWSGNF